MLWSLSIFFPPLLLAFFNLPLTAVGTPLQGETSYRRLSPRQPPPPPPPVNSTLQVCAPLLNKLGPPIVITPFDFAFREAANNAWNLYNTLYTPTCIIHPKRAEDVQRVMEAIYQAGGVKYAVQAGGHSAMREWDTTEDGVLISFADMTNVSYDATRDTINLQPGVRWGEAIAYLEPFGVAPLGGRLGDVGTGLLLGGGLSYLSARHGFSVDALVEADVVLVDGRLVTANATNEYADLFKALKGGANRFGIVTRYEVKAIHVGTNEEKMMVGGSVIYDNSTTEALLRATANYVNNVEDSNTSLLVIIGATMDNNTVSPVNVITFFYNGTSLPEGFANPYHEFLSLPYLASAVGSYSYAEANSVLGSGGDKGSGQAFGASAFGSAEWDISQGLVNDEEESFESFPASPTWSFPTYPYPSPTAPMPTYPTPSTTPRPLPPVPISFIDDPSADGVAAALLAFTPVLKSQVEASRKAGGNVIDPPLTNYALVQFHVTMPEWLGIMPRRVIEARKEVLKELSASAGLPLYMNECDSEQNVFATYGQYEFLKNVYKKYDPTGINMRFMKGPPGL
ncbi:hypothetical protein H1R20_g5134, partial [Candolleomyces eurysporus]